MAVRTPISITTLEVNGLTAQIKDKDWLKGYKNKTYTCGVQDIHFRSRDMYKMSESQERKKVFHKNGNQKKVVVAILLSDKTEFKISTVTGDKDNTT